MVSKRGKTALLSGGILLGCVLLALGIVVLTAEEEDLRQQIEVSYLQDLSGGAYLVRPKALENPGRTVLAESITRYPFGFAIVKAPEGGSLLSPPPQPVAVRTLPLGPQPIQLQVLAFGTVEAEHDALVAVETDGVVSGLPVVLGQEVAEGDPLVTLDSGSQTLAVQRADAELVRQKTIRARLVQDTTNLQEQLDLAKLTLETRTRERTRWSDLASRGMASQDRADQADVLWRSASTLFTRAKGACNNALEGIKEADAAIAVAHAAKAEASLRLTYCTLRAPFPGAIAERHVDLGDFMRRGQQAVRLVSHERVRLRIHVRSEEALMLRPGAQATITVPGVAFATAPDVSGAVAGQQPGPFPGVVEGVSASADPRSRKFAVDVVAANPLRLLRSGMFARVVLQAGTLEQAHLVPDAAVVADELGHSVYVVEGGVAHRKRVILGQRQGEGRLLRSGLEGRVDIVVEGTGLLFDGAPIRLLGD